MTETEFDVAAHIIGLWLLERPHRQNARQRRACTWAMHRTIRWMKRKVGD